MPCQHARKQQMSGQPCHLADRHPVRLRRGLHLACFAALSALWGPALHCSLSCCLMQAPAVKITQVFPEGRTVYSFSFDKSKCKWVPWADLVDTSPIPVDAEYTRIIVPTVDTIRYSFLLNQLVSNHMHCLLVGPTGTGKTVYVKQHLQAGLSDSFVPQFITFSAQTSANMTQVRGCSAKQIDVCIHSRHFKHHASIHSGTSATASLGLLEVCIVGVD